MSKETLQSLLEDATVRYHELLLKNYAKLTLEEKLFLDNFRCYKQLSWLDMMPKLKQSRETTVQTFTE